MKSLSENSQIDYKPNPSGRGGYYVGMRIWRDPYDAAHTYDHTDCTWCIVTPRVCPMCHTLVHNWFEDISDAGRVTMGEFCKCGYFTVERGDRT